MPTRSEVLASKIQQYDAQITDEQHADTESAIAKLAIAQLASGIGGGGGGGGGGDASAANQLAGNSTLTSINTKTPVLGQAVEAASTPVVLPTAQITALTPLSNAGYSTSALQTTGNTSLASIDTKLPSQGQRVMASSVSVAIASDQRVPTDSQRINGAVIATGVGVVDAGTQRITIASDTKIGGFGYESKATITRAANTAAYIANDVYGGSFELTNFGAIGDCVILSGIRVQFNVATLPVGMGGFLLFLYSAAPPSATTDNNAFSVPAGDRATLLTPGGGIAIGDAVLEPGGGSVGLRSDNLNIELKLAPGQTSVWGYLVTRAGFTPAAASETATITALTLGV